MAMTLARALLPLLAVTMVTVAAPLAEQASGEVMGLAAPGDSSEVNIAKRAKEEMLFGNQQNSVRISASKKSVGSEVQPSSAENNDHTELQDDDTEDQDKVAQSAAGIGVLSDAGGVAGAVAGGQEEKAETQDEVSHSGKQSVPDQSNPPEPQESEIAQQPPQQSGSGETKEEEEVEGEEKEEEQQEGVQSQPVPVEGGEHGAEEEGEEGQENKDVQQLVSVQEGGVHSDSESSGEDPGSEDTLSPSDTPADEALAEPSQQQPPAPPSDLPNNAVPATADSETALQALDSPDDEVDDLLQQLHSPPGEESGARGDVVSGPGVADDRVSGVADNEGQAERELMEVTGGGEGEDNGGDGQYRQSLLKYILSHGDEYGRLPQNTGYLFSPDPYYLQQRRRRSPSRVSPFPHIHRRQRHLGNPERELSRAKRTKRDLFDDDNLGYDLDLPYTRQQEEEEQARKTAELQELITYLMALYPALYSNERPSPQLPAYLWQGARYPEEDLEEEEPYWAEPAPAYEEPRVGWEEPDLQDLPPAWEPSFYPEELEEEVEREQEEPDFYPVAAKREMLSFVPGQRRKRYFFPFAREPYTHWGAFVPALQKREFYEEQEDQVDPYRRLRELAMALAEDRPALLWDENKRK